METQQLYHDIDHALDLLMKARLRLPTWTKSQWEYWFSRYREHHGYTVTITMLVVRSMKSSNAVACRSLSKL